jgi:hypothetical protein
MSILLPDGRVSRTTNALGEILEAARRTEEIVDILEEGLLALRTDHVR